MDISLQLCNFISTTLLSTVFHEKIIFFIQINIFCFVPYMYLFEFSHFVFVINKLSLIYKNIFSWMWPGYIPSIQICTCQKNCLNEWHPKEGRVKLENVNKLSLTFPAS